MEKFAILLGGEVWPGDRLRSQLTGARVIAADSGIRHAGALDLEVSLWVGDFDSCSPQDRADFADVEREEWPSDKDQTDGEIAIAHAIRQGAGSLFLVGGLGGRTDHATNILIRSHALPGKICVTSGREEVWPIHGELVADLPVGAEFSIIALDNLDGVSITGAKWKLDGISVAAGSGHTLSNVVTGDLHVSVKSGRAFLCAHLPES